MEINFDKKCVKKALEFLQNATDFQSFSMLLDLKTIDKELNNPFSTVNNKGLLDAELRNKYFYIDDFEKLLKKYAFLFQEKTKNNKYQNGYWNNRLKIDYYAIIGYVLKTFDLINRIEDYFGIEKGQEVFINETNS